MTRLRLQDWVARSGCRPDEHRDQNVVAWIGEPDADFLTHVTRDLEQRAPAPTRAENDD